MNNEASPSTRTIEQVVQEEGVYVGTTAGVSMWPMLRNRRDTIVITPVSTRLKRFDVPLYRRGNDYVLHRVIRVLPDGYLIRGDNCIKTERDVTDDDIVGVLTSFFRKGHPVNMEGVRYRAYVRGWHALFPLRYVAMRARQGAGRVKRCVWASVERRRGSSRSGERL